MLNFMGDQLIVDENDLIILAYCTVPATVQEIFALYIFISYTLLQSAAWAGEVPGKSQTENK